MTSPNLFVSKSDLAYAELRSRILTGILPAGARLAQYDLAESLSMSITPLREAIRRLSSEGLLTVETHRDVRVSAMNSEEARQLFEVRLSLDPTAAELAALRRTDEDIATMRAAVGRLLPVTRQWGEEALTAHRAFHQALYRASHNDVLVKLLDDLWDKSDRYRRLGLELPPGDEPRTRDLQEHHQLVDLVEEGRSVEAGRLMREHITHSLTATAISALEDREGARTG
ncbi:GntR family transcriptional regulator [Streptomyces ambofaciens ATCC 23877]|uniref:GntR family transcriptional regulator n=1 Tax=Streptomyces ambofaciens (strain ATCC 23877 / 3486 / DSM 40053 / JCM 4204 / NBRC 12836 / NRRL B-2516) TaxID=278992 RepID=A0A0K2B1H0_STRA7|nr:GntR family transcriptional regulator [Streptomyces ambofaciens]AKZ59038.1 GntR family transcriptional regulator [Streptomyces ambofaciens ATCC 23877]